MKYLLIGDTNATMFKDSDPNTICFETGSLLDPSPDSTELRNFLRENRGADTVVIVSVNDHHHTRSWRELDTWRELDLENYSQDSARQLYARLANWCNVYEFFGVVLHGSAPSNSYDEYRDLGQLSGAGGSGTQNRIIHSFNRAFIHWAETDPTPIYFASNFYVYVNTTNMFGCANLSEIIKNNYTPEIRDWIWEYMILPCAQHHERVRISRRLYSEFENKQFQLSINWTSKGINRGTWTNVEHCLSDRLRAVNCLDDTWCWQEPTDPNPEVFQELCLIDQ